MSGVLINQTTSEQNLNPVPFPLQATDRVFVTRGAVTYKCDISVLLAWFLENASDLELDNYVQVDSIVNGLASTASNAPLAAAQGKALKELIDGLAATVVLKLDASAYNEHFKGVHASLPALTTAQPTAVAGDYATLDAGTGINAHLALWDADDNQWVDAGIISLTNTDAVPEGSSNLYFTAARAIAAVTTAFPRFDEEQTLTAPQKAQFHANVGTFDLNPNNQTADYTIQADDNDGKTVIRMNVATANSVTITTALTRALIVRQVGVGVTTLVADTGVTLNGNLVFSGQHDAKTIMPVGAGEYDVYGAPT